MGDDKDSIKDILRRSLAEFVGTYFLAFGVGMSSLAGPMGPYVPGLTLMVVVFCFGHVSMASFNPAVSLAMAIRPYLLSWKAMLFYCLAELVAGLLGGLTAWGFGGNVVPGLGLDDSLAKVFFGEFLGTLLLATAVLNAGTSADYEGNSFFGLAIGGTLLALVPILGPVTSAVFNPAVGMLSLLAVAHGHPTPVVAWCYFTAPFLAGAAASILFRLVSPTDHAPRTHLMRGPVDHAEDHQHVPKGGSFKDYSKLSASHVNP